MMEARGRSRTPSRLGSGTQLGEQLFAQKIEQKLQKHNLLLEARLQLHRNSSGGPSQPQSAQHSHGTNTPGGGENESTQGQSRRIGSKGGGSASDRSESARRKERPNSAREERWNAAVSSQKGARATSTGHVSAAKGTRQDRSRERERVIEYSGQVKSGRSVAGMYDPKYVSSDVIQSARAGRSRTASRIEDRGFEIGGRSEREEHPPWLFADSGPSRRSSDRSRVSEGRTSEREGLDRVSSSGGKSQRGTPQDGVSMNQLSGNGHDQRVRTERNGLKNDTDVRRTSEARKGKPIRTLRGQGNLDDLPAAAFTSSESRSSRVPSAQEEIEVLHERIASGTAGPSGRPFSGSLPDEVAQRETDLYQQLYQPLANSLSLRRRQIGSSFGSSDGRSSEPSVSLSRTNSSRLEELLMRVEKDGLQPTGSNHETTRLSTAQGLEGLDSPQGGLLGERRSRPHEEAPGLRAQQTFSYVKNPGGSLSISGGGSFSTGALLSVPAGGGLASLLNGGFLAEGLGPVSSQTPEGSGAVDSVRKPLSAAETVPTRERQERSEGAGSTKSKMDGRDQGFGASTSDGFSRSGSDRFADTGNVSQSGTNQRRPSSAASSRERHVSVPERPASASDAHRPGSRSDPTRGSHVAPSERERPSSDGRARLERSASVKSVLSRSGSMSHVASSGRDARPSDGQPRLERSASGRNLGRSSSKSGVFRIASPLSAPESGTPSAESSALQIGLDTGLSSGASEEVLTLAQERAKLAGGIPRPDRPPAYVRSAGLERARSVSPGGRRKFEDRFEEESKERRRRQQALAQERQEEREQRELAECTFAPVISKTSQEMFDSGSRADFLERVRAWKARRDARLREEKERRARRELKECTFQPAVTRYESPLRERPPPSEHGASARGSFWRSEWDGLPARAPDWEGSLRDGASYYALELQKQGTLHTARERSTSAPPLRPWSALARPEPRNLGMRFDYGLSRFGFEPDRPAAASALRSLGFSPAATLSRPASAARLGESARLGTVNGEVRANLNGEINGSEGHDADVADAYSTASQRALTEWEARHYERMTSARRHSTDLRRLLNQINGSSWRYHLTRPVEPNLSDRAHVKVKALEMPISPYTAHPIN
ncbi:hypothetical protein KFL_000040180 [Klebsormidium nitens]|uniref:Uncharacterized protein n=1 Tax=Klebsormidium nitens TaxID=105231 RepID=A0A1Y1HMI3_KLENI|nr:hypothetical protein KFL_000040180 [Klebsormidium nitens]|eukprot:GAQ77816.1 hypothetical protein KFL_000040180 [Klebsormidium nitens]